MFLMKRKTRWLLEDIAFWLTVTLLVAGVLCVLMCGCKGE